jgi:hypothetical protein
LDSNGNGTYEIGEIHTVTTDAGGAWSFGTNISQSIANNQGAIYEVSEVQQTGWTQTFGGPVAGAYTGLLTVNNTSDENLNFGNFKNIDISGVKFYDANVDGIRDNIEPGINGWNFGLDTNGDTIPDQFAVTAGNTAPTGGTFVFTNLGPGTYTVYELNGLTGTWVATTATVSAAIQASSGMNVTDLAFGNVKLGNGGGRTLGFWSNKNGKSLVGADDLAMLSGLNLKGAAGDDKDFTTYANLRTWLLNGTASNMAYMLSVQLAAMSLNVHNGLVSGGSVVYAPGVTGANGAGFISINALMTEANTALGNDGLTLSGDVNRAYQETLKNALDNANNNLNFLVGLGSWTDSNGNGVIDPGEII